MESRDWMNSCDWKKLWILASYMTLVWLVKTRSKIYEDGLKYRRLIKKKKKRNQKVISYMSLREISKPCYQEGFFFLVFWVITGGTAGGVSLLSRPKIKLANISVFKRNNIQPLFHGQLPLSRGLSREMSQFKQVTRNLWQNSALTWGFSPCGVRFI